LLRALGASHDARYDVDDATAAYQEALALDSTAHDVRWNLADLYRRQRKWSAACRQYTALHGAGHDSGQLHTALGICNTNLGRLGRAIEHLEAAYSRQPGNVEVALRLSQLTEITQSPEYAASILQPAIEARPHAAPLWRRVGMLAFKQKRYTEAVSAFERTIAEGDTAAIVYQRLGISQVGAEQHAAALPNLRRAYRRDTTSVVSAFYLGSAYRGVDSLALAARYYNRSIDVGTQGRVLDAFMQLASVEEERGHEPTAIRAYRTALRLQPERTDLYFYLAALYDGYYQDKSVAARYYEKYLASDAPRSSVERLRSYASDRLRSLQSTLHFQRGRAASDSSDE
jgi:tetratricopeptide (TPR) repeat protein